MKIVEVNEKQYKVSSEGTFYHINTLDSVIIHLEEIRRRKERVRIFCGDTSTGRPWNETYDVSGYVGITTGWVKSPILLHNQSSMGGSLISTDVIVGIKFTGRQGRWLYKHPNFHFPKMEVMESDMKDKGYSHNLIIDGKVFSRHPSEVSANKMILKLTT